jgi:hypothetical protein
MMLMMLVIVRKVVRFVHVIGREDWVRLRQVSGAHDGVQVCHGASVM